VCRQPDRHDEAYAQSFANFCYECIEKKVIAALAYFLKQSTCRREWH
jgi:hypothetical protein